MDSVQHAIQSALADGHLPCASAFVIAEQTGVAPAEIGRKADGLEARLSRCQLGLFGYGSKAEGTHRIVTALETLAPELSSAISAALNEAGKLECASAWVIAHDLGLSKQHVADAAEALKVHIVNCQLGAF